MGNQSMKMWPLGQISKSNIGPAHFRGRIATGREARRVNLAGRVAETSLPRRGPPRFTEDEGYAADVAEEEVRDRSCLRGKNSGNLPPSQVRLQMRHHP